MTDQIVFPPHKGLPYDYAPPTINGFCEWELGLQTDEVEAGWDGSARLTFGGASRLPVVSFQGVRHSSGDFLYLSFLVRFDWHYDTDDGIILVFQDKFSSSAHPAGTRRLVIRPNTVGVGAGSSPTPDFSPSYTDPVTMITQTVPVRTDKDVNYDFATWDSAASKWAHVPITTATNGPFEIRTRSWDFDSKDLCWSVEIKIPTTKMAAGAFASDWIELDKTGSGFGFYFNVLKMVPDPGYGGPGTPDPLIGNMVTEYFWPATYVSGATTKANSITDDDGDFANYESIPINPERMGKGLLTGAGTGVAFDYSAGSPIFINVKNPLGGIVTTGTTLDVVGTNTNEIIAKLKNNGAPADDVRADFRIARFGITGTHKGDWIAISPDPATTLTTPNINPTAFIPTLGANGQLTVNWRLTTAEAATFHDLESDNCIAVYLDSDKNTVFTESATWQNMTLKKLSSSRTQIHVNGKNQGPTHDGGKDHDYLITVVKRLVLSTNDYDGWTAPKGTAPGRNWAGLPFDPNRDNGEPGGNGNEKNPKLGRTTPTIGRVVFDLWTKATQPAATWVVITVGYVRTPKKLTLGGKTYTLYNLVDTCSQVLTHEGPVQRFDHRVTGPGLHRLDDGVYRLPVPSDGEVVLEAASEAIEKGQDDILDRILVLIDKLTSLIDRLGGCAERIDPLQALLKKLARGIKLLPLPASVRDALAQTLSRIGAVQQSLRVLPALRALLEAVEHDIEVLDRIFDQLEAVDPKKLDALLERLFKGDAARVRKLIADFEGRLDELGGLVQLLERAVELLEKVSRLCHDIDGLYALLRGLARALEKVRVFGEGLEERFPVMEKLLPRTDPQRGTIGATIAQITKNGAQFDELLHLLGSLGELEKALEQEQGRIEAIPYQEIAKIAEKLYKAAGH